MNGIERRFERVKQTATLAHYTTPISDVPDEPASERIVYVTRPEPIVPIARRLHEVLSDPAVPEIDRMRLEQLVSLALAMARGERGA